MRLGTAMVMRPALAAVRAIVTLVEYRVHTRRLLAPVAQWPGTRRWSRSVADPGPDNVKAIPPWVSRSLDTVGTRTSPPVDTGAGAGGCPGLVAGCGDAVGAGLGVGDAEGVGVGIG